MQVRGLIVIVLFLFAFSDRVFADQLHLVVNGKSIHTDNRRNWNENNYGLGFEYDFKRRGDTIPLVTGSSFKDSNKQTSNYLGGGVKHRFQLDNNPDGLHVDVGVVGFVMTRHDFKNNDPFLGALPFVSFGNERLAVNATYIPKVSPKMVSLFYFQLMIKLTEF